MIKNSEISGARNNIKENGQRPEASTGHTKNDSSLSEHQVKQLNGIAQELVRLSTHACVCCTSTPRSSGNNVAYTETLLSLGKISMKSAKVSESLLSARHQINHKLRFIKSI